MKDEIENIKSRYDKRKHQGSVAESSYVHFVVNERNAVYQKQIQKCFLNKSEIKLLEIGAGSGMNIGFFKSMGISSKNIFANELLSDRVEELKINHPDITIYAGNALEIGNDVKFDVVFQSTVFTSILDKDFRHALAEKMWNLTNPGGFILWYDFIFDNPKNPDVKKVTVKELKTLFPKGEFCFGKKVTLAPPIGRRVGTLYPFFNLFPLLRSHYVAVIRRNLNDH
jgi:2-polyprenyl-3-methyl-5-hydroxy-6-metoxy-1,4-benzoquinol methylase